MSATLSLVRRALVLAALLGAAAAPRAAAQPVPTASAEPEAVIALERWRTRWVLRADVAGAPRRLLLDTGGGLTLLSPSVTAAAGCTPWGRLTGYNMFGRRFDGPHCDGIPLAVDGHRFVPAVTGLVNMAKLNPADSTLDGIASLDLFEGRTITLDFARGRLVVESPASLRARIGAMRPLPMRVKREVEGLALAVLVGVPTRHGLLWMELDSGNGGTVLVSKPVAALVGLDSAVAGRQTADFALAEGIRVRTAHAFTPDLIMDGNLGMPFLREWVVTLDLQAGLGWIAPAEAAPSRTGPAEG